jgi:adenylate kinase family enzyme
LNFDSDSLRIVVLSGPIGAGKSALAQKLVEKYGAQVIKTRDLIRKQMPQIKEERQSLQRAGERLDKVDGGAWVKNALVRFIEDNIGGPAASGFFVIDSARILGQVRAVRDAYGTAVHHIHLDASDTVLGQRYAERGTKTKEFEHYADVRKSKTERGVRELANVADTVVATDRCTPEAVLVRAIALLGLYPRNTTPLVDVLVGGQYRRRCPCRRRRLRALWQRPQEPGGPEFRRLPVLRLCQGSWGAAPVQRRRFRPHRYRQGVTRPRDSRPGRHDKKRPSSRDLTLTLVPL